MSLKPLKDRIVAFKEQPKEKTASGFLLPGDSKEKPAYAVVESVGPEVKDIKKGDKIIYKEYSGTTVKINKTDYVVLEEKDILAIFE